MCVRVWVRGWMGFGRAGGCVWVGVCVLAVRRWQERRGREGSGEVEWCGRCSSSIQWRFASHMRSASHVVAQAGQARCHGPLVSLLRLRTAVGATRGAMAECKALFSQRRITLRSPKTRGVLDTVRNLCICRCFALWREVCTRGKNKRGVARRRSEGAGKERLRWGASVLAGVETQQYVQ